MRSEDKVWDDLRETYNGIRKDAEHFGYMTTTVYAWLKRNSTVELEFRCYPPVDGGPSSPSLAYMCAENLVEHVDNYATLIDGLPDSVCIIGGES